MIRLLPQTAWRVLFPIGIFLLFGLAVDSQGARPFITDDAGTVAMEIFELEAAADYWQQEAALGLCFKHGITNYMDIGVAFGRCLLPEDERGYDMAELTLKFGLIPDRLAASFGGTFGDPCYSALFVFSQPIFFTTLHLNGGYSAVGDDTEGFLTFCGALTAEVNRFTYGAEIGGTKTDFDWWQLGSSFSCTEWLSVDFGIGGTFSEDVFSTITTGFWFMFPHPNEKL